MCHEDQPNFIYWLIKQKENLKIVLCTFLWHKLSAFICISFVSCFLFVLALMYAYRAFHVSELSCWRFCVYSSLIVQSQFGQTFEICPLVFSWPLPTETQSRAELAGFSKKTQKLLYIFVNKRNIKKSNKTLNEH